jgi:hypothetical protein
LAQDVIDLIFGAEKMHTAVYQQGFYFMAGVFQCIWSLEAAELAIDLSTSGEIYRSQDPHTFCVIAMYKHQMA